jgi:nucleoside-diphosphate-sugar epimerase
MTEGTQMKVVITGNMGYVGPMLSQHLRATHDDLTLIGYDTGFFGHCTTGSQVLPEVRMDTQVLGDVRDFPQDLLDGADAVVHLAAVSNDPMGQRFEQVTEDINYRASRRIAELARNAGVARFVFASSCSMYGAAEGAPKRETDELNPLTAYARSKVAMEQALADMDLGDMVATALRFATACGASDRLRLDLVLNDFVASALANGYIEVLSDGTPWRPLIEVRDMARAIDWGITRDGDVGGQLLRINAGSDQWNYQVKELAEAVQAAVPGTSLSINTDAPPDKRSYRVDFGLFKTLAPEHQPQISLEAAIDGLRTRLTEMGFTDQAFRQSHLVRLRVLESLQAGGQLDAALHWIRRS